MPVINLRGERGSIFIPTLAVSYAKIIIIDDDSVQHTVLDTYSGSAASNYTITASFTRPIMNSIGSFNFKLANIGGRFLNKFNGGEVVKLYLDYTDATTLLFYGRIDNVEYGLSMGDGFFVNIKGRDYPELTDKLVTGVESGSTGDVAIAGVLNNFYSDVKLQFWNGSSWIIATYNSTSDSITWSGDGSAFPSTQINTTYQHKKGLSVISEFCQKCGIDCYMHYDDSAAQWYLRTFIKEAIINTTSNIAYGVNLLSLSSYGKDTTQIYNRAIVYGNTESDNIMLLKTEDDTASQSNLWIKEKVFNESDLTTMEEVQEKANYEKTEGINVNNIGNLTTVCLPNIMPGEMITASIPYCNINGQHKVYSVTHNFKNNFTSSVQLTANSKNVVDMFVQKVNGEEFVSALKNPNNMQNSYTIYFNESPAIMTLTSTEITDEKLRLIDGETSGYAISDYLETDNDITQCELRKYENFETVNDSYQVTNDGGVTWEDYTEIGDGEIHTFETSGNDLGVRLDLARVSSSATSPSYESISLLYK